MEKEIAVVGGGQQDNVGGQVVTVRKSADSKRTPANPGRSSAGVLQESGRSSEPSAAGPGQPGAAEDERLLLTVGEVADLVGLSERTVWKLGGCGELPPPIKIGRSVRWLRRSLEEFLADRQREAEKALRRCLKAG